jgi:hypothetical protein
MATVQITTRLRREDPTVMAFGMRRQDWITRKRKTPQCPCDIETQGVTLDALEAVE